MCAACEYTFKGDDAAQGCRPSAAVGAAGAADARWQQVMRGSAARLRICFRGEGTYSCIDRCAVRITITILKHDDEARVIGARACEGAFLPFEALRARALLASFA